MVSKMIKQIISNRIINNNSIEIKHKITKINNLRVILNQKHNLNYSIKVKI